MKTRIFKISLALTAIVLGIILYLNSSYYIQSQTWKYSSGMHIGDWFDQGNMKMEDGIVYGSSGKAKVVFCFGFRLLIKNIETGEEGVYVNQG
ncbi:hypothetical protein [Flavobacterium terrisoli]|uniref:hypothetical protein n=1 Tax=Flavobacterium terrisoli TaxID=3242195 RepID=UPI002543E88E|nr:hypothetical protein [Flavobacterium buctense]